MFGNFHGGRAASRFHKARSQQQSARDGRLRAGRSQTPVFELLEQRAMLTTLAPLPGTADGTTGSLHAVESQAATLSDLSIFKSDSAGGSSNLQSPFVHFAGTVSNVGPSQSLTYTITVTNLGTTAETGVNIVDPMPQTGFTETGWSDSAGGSGTGSINDTVNIPALGAITYTINGMVSSTVGSTLSNTVTATPSGGTAISATDIDNVGLPDLEVQKTDSTGGDSDTNTTGTVIPGQLLTYYVWVTNQANINPGNAGTGTITGVRVADAMPANFISDTWTTLLGGGATDTTSSGTGNISDKVTKPGSNSTSSFVRYTDTGTISPTATAGSTISNTATATPASGAPISATDKDYVDAIPSLTITKSDNASGSSGLQTPTSSPSGTEGDASPGQTLTYTVVVTNAETSEETGVKIVDSMEAEADFIELGWTAAGTGVVSGFTSSGSGDINDTVNMAPGSSITYTITGSVDTRAMLGSELSNVATVTPSGGTAISATDNDIVTDLTITKTDSSASQGPAGNVTPGESLTYTVVVTNATMSPNNDVLISDPMPLTGFTETGWSSSLGGSGTGSINDTVNIPAGGSITYTIKGTVSGTVGSTLTNTATVTPFRESGLSVTDIDNVVLPILSITKTDSAAGPGGTRGNVLPGQALIYTITVSNAGPGIATGVMISDLITNNFSSDIWVETGSGGASPATSNGTGGIDNFTATLDPDSVMTFVVAGTIRPLDMLGSTLTNTATVIQPGGHLLSATDIDNVGETELAVVKSDNAGGSSNVQTTTTTPPGTSGTVAPGQALTYMVVVTNTSTTATATGVSVSDPMPPEGFIETNWSATGTFGTSGLPTGINTGPIDSSGITLGPLSSVTFTISGTVAPTAATGSTVANTFTVNPASSINPPIFATDSDTVTGTPVLSITKTDSAGGSSTKNGSVVNGQSLTYTITVSNTGTGTASGVTIADTMPVNFINDTWTAAFSGGASDTAVGGTGMGNISDTGTLPANSSITYTVTGTVSGGTTLSNTATVTPVNGTPMSATDTDNVTEPGLTIIKTDSAGGNGTTPGNVVPGQSLTYTIVVSNAGTASATGRTITDSTLTTVFPSGDTWTATTTGSATGFSATGSGNIDDTNVTLPAGSSITYKITGTLSSSATGTLSNTASVLLPSTPPLTATDADDVADLGIIKSDSAGGTSKRQTVTSKPAGTSGTVTQGMPLTYTIIVSDAGPGGEGIGAKVTDTFPPQYHVTSWTATRTGGDTETNSSGTGNINDTVSLFEGATITYVVTGSVVGTGTLTNTAATIAPVAGIAVIASDTDTGTASTNSSLSGFVYVDANQDHDKEPGEPGISNATVVLTGTPTGGAPISVSTTTDITGFYSFAKLAPGNYTITETQPTNYIEGKNDDQVGSQNSGTIAQTATSNAVQNITLTGGVNGINNNFGDVGLTMANVSKRAYLSAPPNVTITKTDSAGGSSIVPTTGSTAPGLPLSYTIVVTNAGTSTVTGTTILDSTLTNNLTGDTWTATTAGAPAAFRQLAPAISTTPTSRCRSAARSPMS